METPYVAHVPAIRGKEDLLKQLNDKLEFPGYFGFNWDALSNCLKDLHWINQHRIVLIHDGCPELEQQDLSIYLRILHEAVLDWKQNGNHALDVVFPEEFNPVLENFHKNFPV